MYSRRDVLFPLLIVYVCSFFVSSKCQSCEESKSYYAPWVVCKNITGKFPTLKGRLTNMKCLDCNIPVVDENTIKNFKGEIFNLSNSHLQSISSTAFQSFDDNFLRKFLLEENDINYIGPRAFSKFSMLDEIILKKNDISSLPDGIFDNTSVTTLDLSYNHLSSINTTFIGLKVSTLNLSCNEITEIENVFDYTIFWTRRQWRQYPQQLDLSNNFISKINPGTFKSFNDSNTLLCISLKNNKLTAIENNTFSQLKYLSFLTLEQNSISKLYPDSFKGLVRLQTLILTNNDLEIIPNSMFADLQLLEFLDLSFNHLTKFTVNTFSGLVHLTKLNISHNVLRVLDDSHLVPLGKLASLDISDTNLRDLNLQIILAHHHQLRYLVINDNFWTCKNLVQMYKQMNKRIGGFDYPTHHYDVPNLHGIACSQKELDSYEDMTFDDFLTAISQDRIFEDLYDYKIDNEYTNFTAEDITNTIKSVRGIFYMLLIITIIITALFVRFITIRCMGQCLYKRNALPDKYSFAYDPNPEDVQLI